MPSRPYQVRVADVSRARGGGGKRGPLAGLILDRGFVQFSESAEGAVGDAPTTRAYDQLNYVEDGVMWYTVGGERIEVESGQAIYVPAGLVRQAGSKTATKKVEIFGSLRLERWEFAEHQLRHEAPGWRGRPR
jgi:mannose-6-phosphate isomerase-like protein (cupin superfamily)